MKFKAVIPMLVGVFLLSTCKDQEFDNPESESNIKFTIKEGSETVYKAIQTRSGGFAYFGEVSGDAFCYVVGPDGNEVWYKTVGGDKKDVFLSAVELRNGDFVAVGTTYSSEYDVAGDNSDMYAVRFSASGRVQWEKAFGGIYTDALTCVAEDPDGNIVLGGASAPSGSLTIVIKVDRDGDPFWGYGYSFGPYHSYAKQITFNSAGDYVIWGMQSPSVFSSEVRKYLTYRNVIYKDDGYTSGEKRTYDEYQRSKSISNFRSHGFNVVEKGNLAYWFTTLIGDGDEDYLLMVKTDKTGNVLMDQKFYVNEGFKLDNAVLDSDGAILVTGSIGDLYTGSFVQNAQSTVCKIDEYGQLKWKKVYGDELGLQSVRACREDGSNLKMAGTLSSAQNGRNMFMYFTTDEEGELIK